MSQMFDTVENDVFTEFYSIYFCVLTKTYSTQNMKNICISQFYRANFALQTMLSLWFSILKQRHGTRCTKNRRFQKTDFFEKMLFYIPISSQKNFYDLLFIWVQAYCNTCFYRELNVLKIVNLELLQNTI